VQQRERSRQITVNTSIHGFREFVIFMYP